MLYVHGYCDSVTSQQYHFTALNDMQLMIKYTYWYSLHKCKKQEHNKIVKEVIWFYFESDVSIVLKNIKHNDNIPFLYSYLLLICPSKLNWIYNVVCKKTVREKN
jgi:hypothetical protein